ncbi:MAG: M23 family metallopeptidase [Rhodospirillales bacterium]|nr:MAG: M23 family metallopeptidase [Rhodospirillales bacterium]
MTTSMCAVSALCLMGQANAQAIRAPQQAVAQPAAKPQAAKPQAAKPQAAGVTSPGAKRITIPAKRPTTAVARMGTPPGGAAPSEPEAVPFSVDPSKPLVDQLAALGVGPADAEAAAKAAAKAMGRTPLTGGHSGRATFSPAPTEGRQLQTLQIYLAGAAGPVVDVQRAASGGFTATGAVGSTSVATLRGGEGAGGESPRPEGVEDDHRRWNSEGGGSVRVALPSTRSIAPKSIGTSRVSANGNANIALARAGIDTHTAQSAAQALAAVAPATLDVRSASIEMVHGRADDGQVRLLTATIYDRSSRGQIWWFAPKGQPEGFFDEHGNRVGDSSMTLPIEGSHISSSFGPRRLGRWYAFHNGADIAGRYGTPIVAAADGVVDYAGWYYNYGKTVRVVHSDSLATSYSHMSNFVAGVGPGTRVRKGQVIGYVGSTGRSTGPHLHFCVLVDGQFVNPAPYIGGTGRLAPQDLVAFRDWQRRAAGASRSRSTEAEAFDGPNRL